MAIKIVKDRPLKADGEFKAEGAVFQCGALTKQKLIEITDKHTNQRGFTDSSKINKELLEYSLLGWSGILDANNNPIPFERSIVSETCDYLPPAIYTGLCAYILNLSPNVEGLDDPKP